MIIEIETHHPILACDLMESSSLSAGQKKEIPGGAILTFEGTLERRAIDFPSIIELTILIGTGTSASIIGNWLYSKIKGKATKLRIDRMEVEIDEGKITRVIKEKIQIED